MKVLALISGGKDSIFNIHKCIENGHQIVALGNLYNIDETKNQQGIELDSYMYQTVGSNITIAIAQAMGLPLYRRKIHGKPVITTLGYQKQQNGDQVQDLYELVLQAKKNHPQINAISSGAIFSTYQKLRVQNMYQSPQPSCSRLSLTSLAYLWKSNQSQLLQQMISYPLNAIIIKIASYGLKASHIGKSLQQLQPLFLKLQKQCGMNVCGEGGEYESMVLDCPLFKKKIIIDQSAVEIVQKNQIAPIAYLKVFKFHLEPK